MEDLASRSAPPTFQSPLLTHPHLTPQLSWLPILHKSSKTATCLSGEQRTDTKHMAGIAEEFINRGTRSEGPGF